MEAKGTFREGGEKSVHALRGRKAALLVGVGSERRDMKANTVTLNTLLLSFQPTGETCFAITGEERRTIVEEDKSSRGREERRESTLK